MSGDTPPTSRGPAARRGPHPTRALLALLACLGATACQNAAERSMRLGDRLMAVGETDRAIAEYKLAERLRGPDTRIRLRIGHAYATRGDVDEALEYYRPLSEEKPELRHQIAADLIALSIEARERGAAENMARSLQPLLDWGLGYVPADLLLSLARHYGRDGDYTRSLGLYLAVLADEQAPEPGVLYEVGRAYEELGGCERALPYFERYVEQARRGDAERDAARWHYGNCLFVSADEERAAGRPSAALAKLDDMVSLGVPRTLIDDAHFLRGEMLLSLGNTESALGAYQRVLDLNPSRTGAMVRRAEERIRQIRFGFEDD